MPNENSRPFTILDGMIIVAASAVAFQGCRAIFYVDPFIPSTFRGYS